MKKYAEIINQVKLFEGIGPENQEAILKCLGASIKEYRKNETIIPAGEKIDFVGIILEGNIVVIKEDYNGNRSILTLLKEGDIFGETFASAQIDSSPVTVEAITEVVVMFIDYKRILTNCPNLCDFHGQMITNMLKLIAERNFDLNKKIDYLLIKSLREKLVIYLLDQYALNRNTEFVIPFDRTGLANFLNVDRSAMSRELCRMRDEGLIEFKKNNFKLLDLQQLLAQGITPRREARCLC